MSTNPKIELLQAATEAATRYIETERSSRVSPTADSLQALDQLATATLDSPLPAAEVVAMLDQVGSPAAIRSTGGRYFGFVNGGVTPAALGASVLATTWDQNGALPVMSPIVGALDALAADMIVDVLGLPTESIASFCGGATLANVTGIVTGRDHLLHKAGWDVHTQGLAGAPPLHVIASAEAHVSVLKTLRVAGIGSDSVTFVPTDEFGRLKADELPEVSGPTLVILQAGNVNTGHSDPFRAIIDQLRSGPDASNMWVHVDGAFGLWANATPNRRHHVDGVDLADSWATDGHKWLNAPYDSGVVICRHPKSLKRSMAMDAAYVETPDDERAPMNLGLQMSQRARAIPVWAILASEGRAGIAETIEQSCQHAEHFAELLSAAGIRVLAPPVLNQTLVRFDDDTTTDAVVVATQADGVCWVGATTWQGQRAMRISVSDTSTTSADVEAAAESIVRCWRNLSA